MKSINFFFLLTILSISFSSYGQSKPDRLILGRKFAENELKSAISDKSQYNVVDNKKIIIKDSLTAINIAEQILFGIYGKTKIREELPYETYFIDNYWVLSGTFPEDYKGGTFLIIIDARDCRVLKITHGK
ncbi:MAG: NTF2 fold immunity protein [Bacteroidales bacterium]